MKRARHIVAVARYRDVLLLHGLEQRGLGAGARAIDLVSHQELAENRTRKEPEAALAARTFLEHLAAENVRWHEIRGELDATCFQPEHDPHGLDELRLGQAGKPDEQGMTARENGDQSLLHHP